MSRVFKPGLLAAVLMMTWAGSSDAQQPSTGAPTPPAATSPAVSVGKLQAFPSPDAAADALTVATRRGDDKAIEAMLGAPWMR